MDDYTDLEAILAANAGTGEDSFLPAPSEELPFYAPTEDGEILSSLNTLATSPEEASVQAILSNPSREKASAEDTYNTPLMTALMREEAAFEQTPGLNQATAAIKAVSTFKAPTGPVTEAEWDRLYSQLPPGMGMKSRPGPNGTKYVEVFGTPKTPAEIQAANPSGFAKNNPELFAKMQAEARGRADAPTQLALNINNQLSSKMQEIMRETDPLKKSMGLGELQVSVSMASADLMRTMRVLAEDRAGVAKAQQWYDRNVKADIEAGIPPSAYTKDAALKLEKAKQQVGILTRQMIAENPTIAAMNTRLQTFMKTQEMAMKQGEKAQNLREAREWQLTLSKMSAEDRKVARQEEREERKQEELQTVADALSPESVKRLGYIFPNVNGDSTKAAERYVATLKGATAPEKQELNAVLSAPSVESLIPMAIQGSFKARNVVLQEHMARTGQDREAATKDVNKFMSIISDEKEFKTAVARMPENKDIKQMKVLYQQLLLDNSKESQKQRQQMREAVAFEFMKTFRENELFENAGSWSTLASDPEVFKIYEKIKMAKGSGSTVSLREIANEFLRVPVQERAARSDRLTALIMPEVTKYREAVIGPVDAVRLSSRLKAVLATTGHLGYEGGGGIFVPDTVGIIQ